MTTYTLCRVAAPQSAPGTVQGGVPGSNLPPGSQMAACGTVAQQSFHIVVTGSGAVSATVQPLASNDGVNWLTYGATISVASGTAPQQAAGNGGATWAYFSAYVTAISGTGAQATCVMSA